MFISTVLAIVPNEGLDTMADIPVAAVTLLIAALMSAKVVPDANERISVPIGPWSSMVEADVVDMPPAVPPTKAIWPVWAD